MRRKRPRGFVGRRKGVLGILTAWRTLCGSREHGYSHLILPDIAGGEWSWGRSLQLLVAVCDLFVAGQCSDHEYDPDHYQYHRSDDFPANVHDGGGGDSKLQGLVTLTTTNRDSVLKPSRFL